MPRYEAIDTQDFEKRIQELETGTSEAGADIEDWRGSGGDSSDTGTLLNAIAAAKAAGGMQLQVPARTYTITQELLIDGSHIWLFGQGAGKDRPAIPDTQASPRTKILWNGPIGGTVLRFSSPTGGKGCIGGGLRGIQLDANAFRAARGLHLESWIKGDFADVVVFAASESQFRFSIVNGGLAAGSNGNVSFNVFRRCQGTTIGGSTTYINSMAHGWHLTGGNDINNLWNTCLNSFYDCNGNCSKGIGWKIEATDDNFFFNCTGSAAYDANQYGIEFGSSDQDSVRGTGFARHNIWHITNTHHVIARSGQHGTGESSQSNVITGYSRANNATRPEIEPPAGGSLAATLFYQDTLGNVSGSRLGMFEGTIAPTSSTLGLATLFIDEPLGQVKIHDSSGNIRTIVDSDSVRLKEGTWTPKFQFGTVGDSVITHTVQDGKWQRVGSFVFLELELEFNTNAYTPATVAAAMITGLPFACVEPGSLAIGGMENVTFSSTQRLSLAIGPSTSRIDFRILNSNAASTPAGDGVFPPSKTGIRVTATGMYWTPPG